MAILLIPAEKRDRDDRTRLMVPFEHPPFIIYSNEILNSKYEIRNKHEFSKDRNKRHRIVLNFMIEISDLPALLSRVCIISGLMYHVSSGKSKAADFG